MSQGEAIKKWFRPARDVLKANPAVLTVSLIVIVNAAGVVYWSVLFAQFGIRFLDHAQIGDLTMAGLRAGFSVVWGALWVFLLAAFVVWASSRKETTFGHRNVWGGLGLTAICVGGLSAVEGWSDSGTIMASSTRSITVCLQPAVEGEPTRREDLTLIGVVDGSWFFFDRTAKVTVVLPLERVHHLEYPLK